MERYLEAEPMKGIVGVLAIVMLAGGCTSKATTTSTPGPTATPLMADFAHYIGAYRSAKGLAFVINGHGHLLNLQDSSFRQLYPTAVPDHFTMGRAFAIPSPIDARVRFRRSGDRADQLTITPIGGGAIVAARQLFKETEVRVPANGAVLAGTVTEPITPGPRPGIVIVHGSGPGPRIDYGIWVGLYATLGLTVLAYDKRGNGASSGTYPGEFASEDNLNIYAADAAAMLKFLSSWPGVDPRRVGFHGGSQGGWVAPLAIDRFHAPASFAIFASAPAVTVDQQGLWADIAGSSSAAPSFSSDVEAQLRAQATGYDPRPVLTRLTQPMIWFNGAVDRSVPTPLNTEILRGLHHSNWEIDVLPGVDHGLFENASGSEADEAGATRLATGLWDLIATWLGAHVGS